MIRIKGANEKANSDWKQQSVVNSPPPLRSEDTFGFILDFLVFGTDDSPLCNQPTPVRLPRTTLQIYKSLTYIEYCYKFC